MEILRQCKNGDKVIRLVGIICKLPKKKEGKKKTIILTVKDVFGDY